VIPAATKKLPKDTKKSQSNRQTSFHHTLEKGKEAKVFGAVAWK
jgi:hypothetical protein